MKWKVPEIPWGIPYHLKHFLDQYLYYTRKKGSEEPDPIQDYVPNENEARGMLVIGFHESVDIGDWLVGY
jgi:hypothetical protein